MNGVTLFFPGQIKEKPGLIWALVEGRMCYIAATRLRLLTPIISQFATGIFPQFAIRADF